MPPKSISSTPKVIHLETQRSRVIDKRTGLPVKPSETMIYGLRTTRAEQRNRITPHPPEKDY